MTPEERREKIDKIIEIVKTNPKAKALFDKKIRSIKWENELKEKDIQLTDEDKSVVLENLEYMYQNPDYLKYVAESIAEKKRNQQNKNNEI